jgi:hypothetical protein
MPQDAAVGAAAQAGLAVSSKAIVRRLPLLQVGVFSDVTRRLHHGVRRVRGVKRLGLPPELSDDARCRSPVI